MLSVSIIFNFPKQGKILFDKRYTVSVTDEIFSVLGEHNTFKCSVRTQEKFMIHKRTHALEMRSR